MFRHRIIGRLRVGRYQSVHVNVPDGVQEELVCFLQLNKVSSDVIGARDCGSSGVLEGSCVAVSRMAVVLCNGNGGTLI